MEIKNISLHELRKMNYSEGLVIQGCGGDTAGMGRRYKRNADRTRNIAE